MALSLALVLALAFAVSVFGVGIDDPVVMLGELEISLGRDPVAGRTGVTRMLAAVSETGSSLRIIEVAR